MPMNLVIQQKRKAMGLTQEQVAAYLNVSTPAVSKWETGITSPDIALLPQLARILRTDLNTLFCFSEELSAGEIGELVRGIGSIIQTEGYPSGFRAAQAKLHEHPHNEALLHSIAIQMDGQLMLSGLEEKQRAPYE